MTTRIVVAVAGALMLVGGVMQLFAVLKLRGAAWRGAAVSATALTVYGLLALSGLVVDGTARGAVLVWVVAIGMWFGIWLSRRDRARSVQ